MYRAQKSMCFSLALPQDTSASAHQCILCTKEVLNKNRLNEEMNHSLPFCPLCPKEWAVPSWTLLC